MNTVNPPLFKPITTLLALLFFNLTYATTPANRYPSNELKLLQYRALNLVVQTDDIQTIEQHIDAYFASQSPAELRKNSREFKLFAEVVKTVQLPDSMLSRLRMYAVTLKSQPFMHREQSVLDDIIWWCEARLKLHNDDRLVYLGNQLFSKRAPQALQLLAEIGDVQTLKAQVKSHSFKNAKALFGLAIRQAELVTLINEKSANFSKDLTHEVARSISQVLPLVSAGNQHDFAYFSWLIKYLGLHKDNPVINEVLVNLTQDPLFYNPSSLSRFENEQLELFKTLVNERLEISSRAKTALSPLTLGFDDQHQIKLND